MENVNPIISVELAGDVKELVAKNPDVKIDEPLNDKLIGFDNDVLVKVTKEFGSLKISGIDEITEELLEKEL